MTQETCARCGAPQREATPFCTSCGNPIASADSAPTPPSPGTGGGSGKRIALLIGVVLLLLIGGGVAAAVVLDDGDDKDKRSEGSGSVEEFCEVWRDFDELDTGEGGSLEEMRSIADRMRSVGAPDDIPDDAQKGIDTLISIVDRADSEDEMRANAMSLSHEDDANISAAIDYAETTCADAGSDEPDGVRTDTPDPDSEGDDLPMTTAPTVTEEAFCAEMRRLDEIDDAGDDDAEFAEGKALMLAIASRGVPEEMPDEAREGFDIYMTWIDRATSTDDFDDFAAELTPDEERPLSAFIDYVDTNCMNSDDDSATSESDHVERVEPRSTGLSPETAE